MRLALGYADGVPDTQRADASGGKSNEWIVEHAAAWFPQHEVRVWSWGDVVPAGFDWDDWLIGYGYSNGQDITKEWQHFVIGTPDFRIDITIVVGVRIGDAL